MSEKTIRGVLNLLLLCVICPIIALAQSPTSVHSPTISNSWQVAQSVASSSKKLIVFTPEQPNRRQTCRVQSFTLEKLVCSRAIGGPRTYLPSQIVALFFPGDHGLKVRLLLGLTGGLAAASWGTVVLAATCPACVVATGVIALALFGAAGAVRIGDEQPDHPFYLAPGRQLTGKFRFGSGTPN
jgi:hypothetical protein